MRIQNTRAKRSFASATARVVEQLEDRAYCTMTIDVRVAGTGSHAITATSVGQVINLQAYAVISGTTAGTNDAFLDTVGSFLGTKSAAGSVAGNLAATIIPTFTASGGSSGIQQDLNADGSLDVGSNSTSTTDGYFVARAGEVDYDGAVSGNTNTFLLANLTYTVTSLGIGAATSVNFRPSGPVGGSYSALWVQDGNGIVAANADANFKIGNPVVITAVTPTPTPTPTPTGAISGTVFKDANSNAKLDSGEAGLSGTTVYLDLNNNGALDSTDPTYKVGTAGTYSFNYLPAGTFYVREVIPSGYKVTTPANDVFSATLVAAQQVTGANFGNAVATTPTPTPTGTISGTVFKDANSNAKLDSGEAGLSGTTVYLDLNNNGALDSTDPTYKVGTAGTYSFNYLPAGTFYVREVIPSGYKVTTPANNVFSATLVAAQQVTGANFGNAVATTPTPTPTPTGSITGEVFSDANSNGKLDSGESALSGVTVYLDLNKNGTLDSTDPTYKVGSNGTYSFNYLPAGTFQVREVVPSGYAVTTPANDLFQTTLVAAQRVTGANFGNGPILAGAISGTVFKDTNGNGKQDGAEKVMSGVTVYLDLNKNGKFDSGDVSYVTGSAGTYSFNYMPAGTFKVGVVIPSGSTRVTTPTGGAYTLTLAPSQKVTGENFGLL